MEESKGRRSKYRVWIPAQRAEIGKHAADHGNASTVRILGLKYPGLKRQTVSDFKLAYLKLKKSNEAANSDIKKIVKKKAGRPTLLPESLMRKVIETVANLRLRGALVSSAVIRAVARGVRTFAQGSALTMYKERQTSHLLVKERKNRLRVPSPSQ